KIFKKDGVSCPCEIRAKPVNFLNLSVQSIRAAVVMNVKTKHWGVVLTVIKAFVRSIFPKISILPVRNSR
ncbi:MAG TPA: hypothetical protein DHW02_14505, partial [Ktedonobacter sp.]|nr:hypothetical protein [Ktedonobacter sp.]